MNDSGLIAIASRSERRTTLRKNQPTGRRAMASISFGVRRYWLTPARCRLTSNSVTAGA